DDYVALAEPGFPSRNYQRVAAQNGDQVAFLGKIDLADHVSCSRRDAVQRILQDLKSPRLETEECFYADSWKLAFNDLLDDCSRADGGVYAKPRHYFFIFWIRGASDCLWDAEYFFRHLASDQVVLVAAGCGHKHPRSRGSS